MTLSSTETRVARIRSLLLLVVAIGAFSAFAYSIAELTVDLDLDFEHRSISLTDSERQKVEAAVAKVRREDWCGIKFALVTGHALASEGPQSALQHISDRRAMHVAELLERLGLPKDRIHYEGRSDTRTSSGETWGQLAELIIQAASSGRPTSIPCKYPKNANGFRMTK